MGNLFHKEEKVVKQSFLIHLLNNHKVGPLVCDDNTVYESDINCSYQIKNKNEIKIKHLSIPLSCCIHINTDQESYCNHISLNKNQFIQKIEDLLIH